MEIRRSPEVARPTAEKKKPSLTVWIWVAIAILVVAGIVVLALFAFGVFGTKTNKTTDSLSNSGSQTSNDTSEVATGITVEPTPDADELTRLTYGRQFDLRKDEDAEKPFRFSVNAVDTKVSATKDLDQGTLFDLSGTSKDIPLTAWAAPNGKLIAVLQDRNYEKKQGEDGEQTLYVTSVDGRARHNIAEGTLNIFGSPVWSEDSKFLFYSEFFTDGDGTDFKITNKLHVFDVANGKLNSFERPQEDSDGTGLLPKAVRGEDLFVVRVNPGIEDPGELGVISLGANAAADGDFEKLMDFSIAGRGFAISHDGKSVVVARGTGESLGSEAEGPFLIELFDRATGELTELRKSPTERYTAPLFSKDDESIVYGAISGLWRLDIGTKKRTNILSSDEADKIGKSAEVTPVSVRPDDGLLLFTVDSAGSVEFMLVDFDADEAKVADLLDLELKDDEPDNFYGWIQ